MSVYMSAVDGSAIDEVAHLSQSIVDILLTRKGSRIERREYGSGVPDLIDRPVNATLTIELYSAVAEALDRWEPRLLLLQVTMDGSRAEQGNIELTLRGIHLPTGRPIEIDGVRLN